MRWPLRRAVRTHPAGNRLLACGLLAALAAGCDSKQTNSYKSVATPPAVQLMRPQVRTIVRTVGQPSFVEAYERRLIIEALVRAHGNQRRAAVELGCLPTTLNEKMRRLGLRACDQRMATDMAADPELMGHA